MNIRYAVSLLAASSVLAGCATTPEDNAELKQMGEEEVRTRFPTLSVGCISPRIRSTDRFPEQRADLDSWAWLNDYNLIVWTHPQRRNSSWLQLETRCNMMRNAAFMSFLDSDGDNLICGTGNDYVVSTTRPLDTTESLLNRDPGIRPRENRCRVGAVRPLDPLELNQVLIYFGIPPLPVRLDDLEDEAPPDDEE